MAVGVQQPDQFAAHLAHQDHSDDVHRLGGGDAESAAELTVDVQAVQHGRNLWATTMDHDWQHTAAAQEDDVLGEGAFQVVVDHGVAAVLDHHDLAGVLGQPWECLDEDAGLGDQVLLVVLANGAHEE